MLIRATILTLAAVFPLALFVSSCETTENNSKSDTRGGKECQADRQALDKMYGNGKAHTEAYRDKLDKYFGRCL